MLQQILPMLYVRRPLLSNTKIKSHFSSSYTPLKIRPLVWNLFIISYLLEKVPSARKLGLITKSAEKQDW